MLNSNEFETYPVHNDKMSSIVDILTFINRKETTSKSLKQNFFYHPTIDLPCSVEVNMEKIL